MQVDDVEEEDATSTVQGGSAEEKGFELERSFKALTNFR